MQKLIIALYPAVLIISISACTAAVKPDNAPRAETNTIVLTSQAADTNAFIWTPEALEELNKAPEFIRPVAKKKSEEKARAKGYHVMTKELMLEIRKEMGR